MFEVRRAVFVTGKKNSFIFDISKILTSMLHTILDLLYAANIPIYINTKYGKNQRHICTRRDLSLPIYNEDTVEPLKSEVLRGTEVFVLERCPPKRGL